ncbi:MAG: hypothetical protein ACKO9Z_03015 [Planctomycetota bacterium]|jgi:hypothetical protein|nr:hypothetical protein [Planctomycetota bacterium]
MNQAVLLDREEYIEQAYLFRVMRERMAQNMPAQEVLERVDQEILASTRLPLAVQFLASEMKHSGSLASGFTKLPHYFTGFQAHVIECSESETLRFQTETALLLLEREAGYRAGQPTPQGLFIYQFESLSRNKLGYDQGLVRMAHDPLYPPEWRHFVDELRFQVGVLDFADIVYVRSSAHAADQRRLDSGYEPSRPVLFGDKEGRIARANMGRDPLYLFAALQRQLGYPEVPRVRPVDSLGNTVLTLQAKLREMETRLKLLESEVKGQFDLQQLKELGRPELLSDAPES